MLQSTTNAGKDPYSTTVVGFEKPGVYAKNRGIRPTFLDFSRFSHIPCLQIRGCLSVTFSFERPPQISN